MQKSEIEEIVHETLRQLDYIPKEKVQVSLSKYAYYNSNGFPIFGVTQVHRGKQPKLHFPIHFQHIIKQNDKIETIRHEVCHLVQSGLYDFDDLVRRPHGEEFQELMQRINCTKFRVHVDEVDDSIIPYRRPDKSRLKLSKDTSLDIFITDIIG